MSFIFWLIKITTGSTLGLDHLDHGLGLPISKFLRVGRNKWFFKKKRKKKKFEPYIFTPTLRRPKELKEVKRVIIQPQNIL